MKVWHSPQASKSVCQMESCARFQKASTGKGSKPGHSALSVLLSGARDPTNPPGSHHQQGIHRGFDPSESLVQCRTRRSLTAIRWESAGVNSSNGQKVATRDPSMRWLTCRYSQSLPCQNCLSSHPAHE